MAITSEQHVFNFNNEIPTSKASHRICTIGLLASIITLALILYVNVFGSYAMESIIRTDVPGSSVIDAHRAPRQYVPPQEAHINQTGQPIRVHDELMKSLGIPFKNFSHLDSNTVKDFVFVTGASLNHFHEVRDAIACAQAHMPGYKIHFYDLGLSQSELVELQQFCDVVYHKFDFTKYPKHVKNLYNYAFKPLIIQEVLREHRALVWMDASFRLLKPLDVTYTQIQETGGYLMFWHSPHSNYAVTDPRMYKFIPTQVEKQKITQSRAAGAVYWHNTDKVYWNIFYWWVMCALDEDCITLKTHAQLFCNYWWVMCAFHEDCITQKPAQLFCNFRGGLNTSYANCHRFDMSVLNVLAANLYGYDDKIYTCRDEKVVTIVKHPTSMKPIKTSPCAK